MQKSNPAFCSQLYSRETASKGRLVLPFIFPNLRMACWETQEHPLLFGRITTRQSNQNLTNWKRNHLTHYKANLCVSCLGGLRWEGDNVHCGWSALQQHLQCSGKGLQQDRGQPLQQDIGPADFRG